MKMVFGILWYQFLQQMDIVFVMKFVEKVRTLCHVIGMILEWLMKKYLPSTIGFFYFIQPVAGVVLAWLILGEDPGRGLIAGLILVCAGAIIFSSESIIKARRHDAQVSIKG